MLCIESFISSQFVACFYPFAWLRSRCYWSVKLRCRKGEFDADLIYNETRKVDKHKKLSSLFACVCVRERERVCVCVCKCVFAYVYANMNKMDRDIASPPRL